MSNYFNNGVLDIKYAEKRENSRALRDSLERRTLEVLSAIKKHTHSNIENIIDLGAADGRMLDFIRKNYPETSLLGIEYSVDLVNFANKRFPEIQIVQGDIQHIDYESSQFDIAIATAVIEHLDEPLKLIEEAKRILKPGGILIVTSPDPFWERIATFVGYLKDDNHNEVMNLKRLSELFVKVGFEICYKQKFMLCPFRFYGDLYIEKVFKALKLNFLFANQIIVGQKQSL